MIEDWNVKVGSQEIPGVTDKTGLGIQSEARQRLSVLPIEHTHHSKHPLPTTQEMIYTWILQDGQHRNQIDYTVCN